MNLIRYALCMLYFSYFVAIYLFFYFSFFTSLCKLKYMHQKEKGEESTSYLEWGVAWQSFFQWLAMIIYFFVELFLLCENIKQHENDEDRE